MPQLSIVRTADLLPAQEQQIRSFIRLHWHDEYAYNLDTPIVPPERDGIHIVLAERHALFSHARLHRTTQRHGGSDWRVLCLGDVLTYPAFRDRGYGSRVVAAATDLIRSDETADFGLLFCDPVHADFYARHGWTARPNLQVTIGVPDARELQGGLPMVYVVSRAAEANPLSGVLELQGYGW